MRLTTLRPIANTRLSLDGGRADGVPELVVECVSREERDALHAALAAWVSVAPEHPGLTGRDTDATAPGLFVVNPGL